jgi:hypothetical protein
MYEIAKSITKAVMYFTFTLFSLSENCYAESTVKKGLCYLDRTVESMFGGFKHEVQR